MTIQEKYGLTTHELMDIGQFEDTPGEDKALTDILTSGDTALIDILNSHFERSTKACLDSEYAIALVILKNCTKKLALAILKKEVKTHDIKVSDLMRIWGMKKDSVMHILAGRARTSPKRLHQLQLLISQLPKHNNREASPPQILKVARTSR
ncbi:MAG: hypothetical protein AAF442_09460 [Pseudomonadota bacterium]